jgi:hypothetical protein
MPVINLVVPGLIPSTSIFKLSCLASMVGSVSFRSGSPTMEKRQERPDRSKPLVQDVSNQAQFLECVYKLAIGLFQRELQIRIGAFYIPDRPRLPRFPGIVRHIGEGLTQDGLFSKAVE